MSTENTAKTTLPVLPVRDIVMFPGAVVPLFVGREPSMKALADATSHGNKIFVPAQIDGAKDDVTSAQDLHKTGVVCEIVQMIKLPDGTMKVLLKGQERAVAENYVFDGPFIKAPTQPRANDLADPSNELASALKVLKETLESYSNTDKQAPKDLIATILEETDPAKAVDLAAHVLPTEVSNKQALLETDNVLKRTETIIGHFGRAQVEAKIERKVKGRVKEQMEKTQREYYLNEQMKAIQRELRGEGEGDGDDLVTELEKKLEAKKGLTDEAREKAQAELKKLRNMSPMSAEAGVSRNYLDWLLGIPWGKENAREIKIDIPLAKKIMDSDHYGQEQIKKKILQYLAVQKRVGDNIKGPILCLVGPPGVGKTSLGKSVAKATGREFTRISLGGVRDEAEVRGHRRTYIGSMPGKIIQTMKKAKSSNPLILLDEIDKMGSDHRGDPASAMLEVLDKEQNDTFMDHYLEVEYDLSQIFFLVTANYRDKIPPALYDRLHVVSLPGYTEDEKYHIAREYLIPKTLKENGLNGDDIEIDDSAIHAIVRYYTREAGVRNLEKAIIDICREVAYKQEMGEVEGKTVISGGSAEDNYTGGNIKDFLGVRIFDYGIAKTQDVIGSATGLAYTEVGGDILEVQSETVSGKSFGVKITGKLGDVMKESSDVANTVVRKILDRNNISFAKLGSQEVHIHVPEGATPKDGPSAGITFVTSGISSLTNIPVRRDIGMTGEVDIKGNVLPIGGLKEKLIAAHRAGLTTILIPAKNEKDLEEIPKNIIGELAIIPVKTIDEVLFHALTETLDVSTLSRTFGVIAEDDAVQAGAAAAKPGGTQPPGMQPS